MNEGINRDNLAYNMREKDRFWVNKYAESVWFAARGAALSICRSRIIAFSGHNSELGYGK